MKLLVRLLLVAALAAAAFLAFWPVPIAPVAWHAPEPPTPGAPPYPPDRRLATAEWLARGEVAGPEAIAFDRAGRPHTGLDDGRIVRLEPTGRVVEVARTGGRPLGLDFAPDGTLWIADADRGLLARGPDGAVRVVATEEGGVPFRFTDDVKVAPDGTVYFTDASARFGRHALHADILEHAGTGRLLAWDPRTRHVTRLLGGLAFANGIALNADATAIAVAETAAYRVRLVHLAGPRRGQADVLVDDLPGLPDNVTWSPERRAFWIALYTPRVKALDVLAPHPWLRKVVYRLPAAVQPAPARHAWIVAVDERGHVLESLQDDGPGSYAPVTSALERDGWLWLGSLTREAVARVKAPPVPQPARGAGPRP